MLLLFWSGPAAPSIPITAPAAWRNTVIGRAVLPQSPQQYSMRDQTELRNAVIFGGITQTQQIDDVGAYLNTLRAYIITLETRLYALENP